MNMKFNKIIYILFLLLVVFVVGCGEEDVPLQDITLSCKDIIVEVGQKADIDLDTNAKSADIVYEATGTNFSVDGDKVKGEEIGEGNLKISVKNSDKKIEINVITISDEGLTIIGNNKLTIETETTLKAYTRLLENEDDITWKSSNNNVARVSKGVVTGVGLGKANITAKFDDEIAKFEIEVIRPIPTEISCKDQINFEENAEYKLNYEVLPNWASQDIKIEADNDCVTILENNKIKCNKTGKVKLTVTSIDNNEVVKDINITVMTNEAPKFEIGAGFEELPSFEYGSSLDFMKGIKVIDNADGDITDTVVIDDTFPYHFGETEVRFIAKDSAGNETKYVRKVNLVWPYHVKFIGHSGSYLGVPNTEGAFLAAVNTLHYQALECDVHITSDGVFVTSHDSTIKDAYTGESYVIEQCTYDVISKVTLSSGGGAYLDHVCPFERYLDICKDYNMIPIIELKSTTGISSSSQANLPKLVQMVKEKGLWNVARIISFTDACLSWFRLNGYNDIKLQALKQTSDSQTTLDFCKKYNIDLSINVTYSTQASTDEWLKKYREAGLEISTWTFSSVTDAGYKQVQSWIDKGVDYVTCDKIVIDKLDLSNNRY